MKHTITIFLFLVFGSCSVSLAGQEYFVFTKGAWRDYASGVQAEGAEPWLLQQGYSYMKYDSTWVIPDQQCNWLYYRKAGLRVWFIAEPPSLTSDYKQFRSNLLQVKSVKDELPYVSIQQVVFPKGSILYPSDLMYEIGTMQSSGNEDWSKPIDEGIKRVEEKLSASIKAGTYQFTTYLPNSVSFPSDIRQASKDLNDITDLWRDIPLKEGVLSDIQGVVKKYNLQKYSPWDEHNGVPINTDSQPIQFFGSSTLSSRSSSGSAGGKNTSANSGGANSTGGGAAGIKFLPLPIKVKFSKWLQVLVVELMEYLQIKELTAKTLLIAYLIAPDLIENCAHFFEDLHELSQLKELDSVLDKAAEIYQNLDKYLSYLQDAHQLLTSPELLALVEKVDLKEINLDGVLNAAEKAGINLEKGIGRKLQKIKTFLPISDISINGIQNLTLQDLEGKLQKGIANYTQKELIRRLSPYGVDVDGLFQCGKSGNCEEWLKQQTKSLVGKYVPKRVSRVADDLLNGNLEQAVVSTIENELRDHLPASINVTQLYTSLKNGNFLDAVEKIGRDNLQHLKEYEALARSILDGKPPSDNELKVLLESYLDDVGAGGLAPYVNQGWATLEQLRRIEIIGDFKLGFSKIEIAPEKLGEFLKRGGRRLHDAVIEQLTKDFGFDDIVTSKISRGDLNSATTRILEVGKHTENYRSKAIRLRQLAANRTALTRLQIDLADKVKAYSKQELETLLLDYRIRLK